MDTAVFGKIAGEAASRYAKGSEDIENTERYLNEENTGIRKKIEEWRKQDSGEKVHKLMDKLKIVMSEKVGIFRLEKDLGDALETIRSLREDYKRVYLSSKCLNFSQELINIIEFDSMLDLAEVITVGALNRKETRGSHFRKDFPKRNDRDWLKHTLITWRDGKPEISYKDVVIGKYIPEERTY